MQEEGEEVEATQSLLQAWDWCGWQPGARALPLKALKEGGKAGGVRRLDQVKGPGCCRSEEPLRKKELGMSDMLNCLSCNVNKQFIHARQMHRVPRVLRNCSE